MDLKLNIKNKWVAIFYLIFILVNLNACQRPNLETHNSSIVFDIPQRKNLKLQKSIKQSLNIFEVNSQLTHLFVNIKGEGIAEAIVYQWDYCSECAVQVPLSSVTLMAPKGKSRLIQVLAIYETENSTDSTSSSSATEFNYGDTLKDFTLDQENVVISIKPIANTGSLISGSVSGRFLTSVNDGPTGKLMMRYSPPEGRPKMTLSKSAILSGWFNLFVLEGVPFDYELESGKVLFSQLDLSSSLLSPSSQVGRVKLPQRTESYTNESGQTVTNTREPEIAVFGFFGDSAFTSSKKACTAKISSMTSYTGLYAGTSTTVPLGVGYNSFNATITDTNKVMFYTQDCLESDFADGTLFLNTIGVLPSNAKHGSDSLANFYIPFQFYFDLTNPANGSSPFKMNYTTVDQKINLSLKLLPQLNQALEGIAFFKNTFGVSPKISDRGLDGIPCDKLSRGEIAGFSEVQRVIFNSTQLEYNTQINLPQTEYTAKSFQIVVCPFKNGNFIASRFFIDGKYFNGQDNNSGGSNPGSGGGDPGNNTNTMPYLRLEGLYNYKQWVFNSLIQMKPLETNSCLPVQFKTYMSGNNFGSQPYNLINQLSISNPSSQYKLYPSQITCGTVGSEVNSVTINSGNSSSSTYYLKVTDSNISEVSFNFNLVSANVSTPEVNYSSDGSFYLSNNSYFLKYEAVPQMLNSVCYPTKISLRNNWDGNVISSGSFSQFTVDLISSNNDVQFFNSSSCATNSLISYVNMYNTGSSDLFYMKSNLAVSESQVTMTSSNSGFNLAYLPLKIYKSNGTNTPSQIMISTNNFNNVGSCIPLDIFVMNTFGAPVVASSAIGINLSYTGSFTGDFYSNSNCINGTTITSTGIAVNNLKTSIYYKANSSGFGAYNFVTTGTTMAVTTASYNVNFNPNPNISGTPNPSQTPAPSATPTVAVQIWKKWITDTCQPISFSNIGTTSKSVNLNVTTGSNSGSIIIYDTFSECFASSSTFTNPITIAANNSKTLYAKPILGAGLFGNANINITGDISQNYFIDISKSTDRISLIPNQISSNMNLYFNSVTTGQTHTCGLTSAGAIYCWGGNGAGQLGNGTNNNHSIPKLITAGTNVFIKISAGSYHTCAINNVNNVFCWGLNNYGQLGTGSTIAANTPVQINSGNQYSDISAGEDFTCGVETSTSDVYCWGKNNNGQLGIGNLNDQLSPITQGTLDFNKVSAGFGYACGITVGNTAKCWGLNSSGQLGDGSNVSRNVPTALNSGINFIDITTGVSHTCAIDTSNKVYCWGNNSFGSIGDNTTTIRFSPVASLGVGGGVALSFSSISAGYNFTCGVQLSTGAVYCWGINNLGELGINSTSNSTTPVLISPTPFNGAVLAQKIDAGYNSVCASNANSFDSIQCWGNNNLGQLGNGEYDVSQFKINDMLSFKDLRFENNSVCKPLILGFTNFKEELRPVSAGTQLFLAFTALNNSTPISPTSFFRIYNDGSCTSELPRDGGNTNVYQLNIATNASSSVVYFKADSGLPAQNTKLYLAKTNSPSINDQMVFFNTENLFDKININITNGTSFVFNTCQQVTFQARNFDNSNRTTLPFDVPFFSHIHTGTWSFYDDADTSCSNTPLNNNNISLLTGSGSLSIRIKMTTTGNNTIEASSPFTYNPIVNQLNFISTTPP